MDRSVVKQYYDRVTAVEIGEVARKLLGDRLTATQGECLRFDCPRHPLCPEPVWLVPEHTDKPRVEFTVDEMNFLVQTADRLDGEFTEIAPPERDAAAENNDEGEV